ncbi:putative tail protein [Microcystis phage Me-ZS1]|nr:putative tail protein [Microcystis phage Me-ZS1]
MANRRWSNADAWSAAFDWLGNPVPRYAVPSGVYSRVIVQVGDGGAGTSYFSDGPYFDLVTGLVVQPRLAKTINYELRIGTQFWNSSGRSIVNIGNVEVLNSDGAYDEFVLTNQREKNVTVRVGWSDRPYSEFLIIGRAIVDRVEAIGEDRFRVILTGAEKRLDRAVQTREITTGTFAGSKYPVTIGRALQLTPVHINTPTLQFVASDSFVFPGSTPAGTIELRDQGVQLTSGTQHAMITDGSGDRLIELYQATAGKITCTYQGEGPEFSTFNNARLRNAAIALLSRSPLGASVLDVEELLALQNESPTFFGRYINNGETFSQVLTEIGDSVGGYWYIDKNGTLRIRRLLLPAEDEVPFFTVDDNVLVTDLDLDEDTAPGLSNVLLFGRNTNPLTESEQAGSVRDTPTGAQQRQRYLSSVTITVAPMYERNIAQRASSRGREQSSEYGMPHLFNAPPAAEVAHRQNLYAAPRCFIRCGVELNGPLAAAFDIGDCITFSLPRYFLAGHKMRLVGIAGEAGKDRVDLICWGATPTAFLKSEKE